jgi:solute:Na+ symporter, SSS family
MAQGNLVVGSIIVGYLILSTAFGLWASRKVKTSSDYLIAGGRMGFLLVAMTLVGNWEGMGASVGVSQVAYDGGIYAGFYSSFFAAGLVLTVFTLLKFIRSTVSITPAELLGKLFGVETRVLTAVLLLFQNLIVLAMQLVGGAGIMAVVLGIPYEWGLLAIVSTMGLYTLLGGIVSVAWANILHAILLNLVAWVSIPVVLAWAGGWDALVSSLPARYFAVEGIGFSKLAGWWWTLAIGVIVVGFQQVQQATSSREAEKGFWLAAALVSVYSIPFALMGVAAAASFPEVSALMAMPTLAMALHPAFAGFLFASVLAAVLANPGITLQPLYFVNDLWKVYRPQAGDRELLMVDRLSLLGTIVLIVAIAATVQQIVTGLLLKGRRMITREGAFAGILCGALGVFISQHVFPSEPPIYGTVAFVVLGAVTTSLLTRHRGRFGRSVWDIVDGRSAFGPEAERGREHQTA